jgi:hypothetical protein
MPPQFWGRFKAGRLAAERYDTRATQLDDDIAALRRQAAELQASLDGPQLPTSPTHQQLAQLHDDLVSCAGDL